MSNGYESIIDTIASAIPREKIQLNRNVEKVKYSPEDGNFKVSLKNTNYIQEAHHVIVTPSLGYLQENAAAMFDPPLSTNKMAAIKRMGFGTVNKIFLEFENLDFIPDENTGLIMFVRKPEEFVDPNQWTNKVYTCYVESVPLVNILAFK